MGSLFEWITDWIKEGLIDAITGQYTSIFNSVNNQVADVANQVGQTPQGWNGGVFSMIQNLSETVVIPIAGMILTFVLVYELIQMILEKNNMHEFDTFNIFKWIFKTFVATYLLTNCFTIVMAVFDVAQNVVSQSAGVINGNLDVQAALSDLETQLEAMGMWELIGLPCVQKKIRLWKPLRPARTAQRKAGFSILAVTVWRNVRLLPAVC